MQPRAAEIHIVIRVDDVLAIDRSELTPNFAVLPCCGLAMLRAGGPSKRPDLCSIRCELKNPDHQSDVAIRQPTRLVCRGKYKLRRLCEFLAWANVGSCASYQQNCVGVAPR